MNKTVAGIVIWYNPKQEYVKNIETYLSFLDILYVYDNSESSNLSLLKKIENLDKVKYINKNLNLGIAFPLNEISNVAFANGYKWLLTMDQDSYFLNNSIQKFTRNLNNHDIGILSPNYIIKDCLNRDINKVDREIENVITSGNLINLNIYKKTEGFDNNLFIDEVDHDYCLKLKLLDKKIVCQNDVELNHELGERNKKFGISYTEHNFIRKYYIWRNKLYMIKKYPILKKKYMLNLFKDIIKIICFEKDKIKKIKYIIKAISDFKNEKYGKIKNEK
ncbi:MAG: glycosyltransferase [Fusobacteriaceae bacterium]